MFSLLLREGVEGPAYSSKLGGCARGCGGHVGPVGQNPGFRDAYASAASSQCGRLRQQVALGAFLLPSLPVSMTRGPKPSVPCEQSPSVPFTGRARPTSLIRLFHYRKGQLPFLLPPPPWRPRANKYSIAIDTQQTSLGAHLSQHSGHWCADTPRANLAAVGPCCQVVIQPPGARTLDGPRRGAGDK